MKKSSESYRRGKQHRAKEKHMTSKKSDPALEALIKLKDRDIDTSDIPEVTDWSKAVVGKFYRPIKEPVTIRLDADVIAWLRKQGKGYQTRANALLRAAMLRDLQQKAS